MDSAYEITKLLSCISKCLPLLFMDFESDHIILQSRVEHEQSEHGVSSDFFIQKEGFHGVSKKHTLSLQC